jgi:glycosyltransferase A (GT-A) superfamily protein (DUF2064 family)
MKQGETSRRATLFFTRAPISEARHKRFHSIALEKQARLYEAFIEHISTVSKKSNLPLVCAVDEPSFFESRINAQHLLIQNGDSFSERLAGAIDEAFALGYEELIVIGNDSPAISATHFQMALQALSENDLSLGESTDGGVYLIALKKDSWEKIKAEFDTIRWLSPMVFTDLCQIAAEQHLLIFYLQRLSEFDSLHDVPLVLAEITSEIVFRAVSIMIEPLNRVFTASYSAIQEVSQINRLRFQKAPPFRA